MNTQEVPPSGYAVTFTDSLESVQAPNGFSTISAFRVYVVFSRAALADFSPILYVNDEQMPLTQTGAGAASMTWVAQFSEPVPAPAAMSLVVDFTSEVPLEGDMLTFYAWSGQTASGHGAFNPDEGGEETVTGEVIEIGSISILSWLAWNRLQGQGDANGS
jgi:hypothetical protein